MSFLNWKFLRSVASSLRGPRRHRLEIPAHQCVTRVLDRELEV